MNTQLEHCFSPFQPASSGLGIRVEGTTRNSTLVCVPIMAESIDKMIIDVMKAGESGADIVEIRLDALKIFNPHEDLKTLIKESPVPTLFTYRYLACIFHHSVILHGHSLLDWGMWV